MAINECDLQHLHLCFGTVLYNTYSTVPIQLFDLVMDMQNAV